MASPITVGGFCSGKRYFPPLGKASPVLAADWLMLVWWAGFEAEAEVGPMSHKIKCYFFKFVFLLH